MKKVIIHVNTGIDDAMALSYAVDSPELEVCGVTTTFGKAVLPLPAAAPQAVSATQYLVPAIKAQPHELTLITAGKPDQSGARDPGSARDRLSGQAGRRHRPFVCDCRSHACPGGYFRKRQRCANDRGQTEAAGASPKRKRLPGSGPRTLCPAFSGIRHGEKRHAACMPGEQIEQRRRCPC